MKSRVDFAVIGGGPAGLYAAETLASAGAAVTLFEAKPSVGRKFLVAGRGGLNLTHEEPPERFAARYRGPGQPEGWWARALAEFDHRMLRRWADELGVETFVASTGRVYPRELKAAPLLRRWVQRLRKLGVQFAPHHRWTGLQPGAPLGLTFQTPDGTHAVEADALILALGGGSWPQTGSDGSWTAILESLGVSVSPLQSANCGWELPWPAAVLAAAEGQPLKNLVARAGGEVAQGELLVTRYGLEGGALYQLGAALRALPSPELSIDFKPSFTAEQLIAKLGPVRRNFLAEARQRWRLAPAVWTIVENLADRAAFESAAALALAAKDCRLQLTGPRPLDEAISSAGGVAWSELDDGLMIRRLPGVFVAGEMIDWEAPTGGYLLQGCFTTGTLAARTAQAWRRSGSG